MGFQGALKPLGKVTLGSKKVSWSLNNNPVIFRDIIQGQRKIAENPREVYRNLRGVLWTTKRSIGTFWALKEITWGLGHVISSFIVVIWGSWGATWGPREVPRGLLHYPSWPQEEELNIKQETYGGDIPLIRAEMRAFSCVIFILTPFLNGLS